MECSQLEQQETEQGKISQDGSLFVFTNELPGFIEEDENVSIFISKDQPLQQDIDNYFDVSSWYSNEEAEEQEDFKHCDEFLSEDHQYDNRTLDQEGNKNEHVLEPNRLNENCHEVKDIPFSSKNQENCEEKFLWNDLKVSITNLDNVQEISVEPQFLVNLFDELPKFEYESENGMNMPSSDHHSDEDHLDKVLIQEQICDSNPELDDLKLEEDPFQAEIDLF